MKKSVLIILITVFGFTSGFIAAKKDFFSAKDIRSAQKLIGIDFSKKQIDTLTNYLHENLKGYEAMRKISLDNEISPAFQFHTNFRKSGSSRHQPIDWKIDTSIQLPDTLDELAFYSITDLAGLIRSKKITSLTLTEFFLARIKKYDDTLKSVISITQDIAIRQAKKADEEIARGDYRGVLHGIPYGLKDLFTVRGTKTTWGAAPYKEQSFDYDATVVKKLEEAGAVLIAKLVSGELARGDVWFGGKTKNPWDLKQGASGSSAGPGAAVSAALVPFAIGTETYGSIISPSARCGVTGLRPTFGRVSRYGAMTLSWSMDKPGPIGRNATDCAIVLEAIMGSDGKDQTVIDAVLPDSKATDPLQLNVRFEKAISKKDSSYYNKQLKNYLELLKQKGLMMTEAELPTKGIPFNAFDIILRAEAGAFFDELIISGKENLLTEQNRGSRANSLRQARFIPAVEYIQANRHRQVLMNKMDSLFQNTDVLIVPSDTTTRQSLITNLTGHPSMALPIGVDDKGHPMSIILIGNLFQEDKLICLARWMQTVTAHHTRRPKYFR